MKATLFDHILSLPLWIHTATFAGSAAAFVWVKGRLDASYAASGHPVSYAEGQTSFSAEKIRGWYQVMTDAGTLDVYWRTQIIDYGFMAALFLLGLFGGLLVARLWRQGSIASWLALFGALAVPLGTVFDALENGVSFIMLADPAWFPSWLAVPYSGFAVVKFACILAGMLSIILSLPVGAVGRLAGRPSLG